MNTDIVVIGGGVAGGAIAARLASTGLGVLVLERDAVYRDVVRGEGMVSWGYLEAVALGLDSTILGAPGASVITRMVRYDETVTVDEARAAAVDLSAALPGSPGVIGVGHPELREALVAAATKAGAEVIRGVAATRITPGARPSVSYQVDGLERSVSCRLAVVADGKNSATRTALRIPFHVSTPRVMLTGMAADDGGAWDRTETTLGVDGRNLFIIVPRGDGMVRLYVGRSVGDPEPFTGRDRQRRFLEAFRTPTLPHADALADATPTGPCASFPMTDSWTEALVLPGVALIGDAAGWSNPVTAQGLSISLRDARVLSEALLSSQEWTPAALRGYVEERTERMRRLRFASALTDLLTAFGLTDRAARRRAMVRLLAARPELGAALAAVHGGAWTPPEAAFSPDILTTIALAA
ncbi:FAD-dependent oxidoreductase [Cryptosporangium aurantiacum]|uniref:2-polyprenyl-6-methoxyphenol hydroxylase n=1 Tax=Cryptosporangium aurantiacum TaxID=134849 RepID=A0A1M7PMD7_9ACTN|nr:NAD(P)/FAD-dependent oxidoreductase [Cryptosporangium aurantiacum]SHN18230.1 2-polyprenyl-6-methoxyphenol hydroxylase [Cryptosporangium aurantiacum]